MICHLRTLIEGWIASPEARLSALMLLLTPERHTRRKERRHAATDFPRDISLPQLLEAQAERTPQAVALICGGQSLTFAELHRRANQLARCLQKRGVGPESLVGLCIERSPEMVIGLLGILKAGGAYIPLDPGYPPERLASILTDAGADVLVTRTQEAARLPEHSAQILCLDDEADAIAQEEDGALPVQALPDHLAYVIYTSGSTGKPKGVQIEHRALVNFLCSMQREPGLTSSDRLLAVTTLCFDIAALEIFLPLLTGACCVLAAGWEAADGHILQNLLTQQAITVMQATPATWRLLIQSGWQGSKELKILCGGEALPPDLAAQLLTRSQSLWNLYGPTETTIWSTLCRIERAQTPISIGRPIANTRVYILDSQRRQVSAGAVGEIYLAGEGLARGYLNRPDLTAERFLPDPFFRQTEARMYRTGDLGRFLPDGSIECLGRVDTQVKIRGFRIELGEIEVALRTHPQILEAVVTAGEAEDGEKRLIAYIVPSGNAEDHANEPAHMDHQLSRAELRSYLKTCLPDYMIPASFVRLEALPRTPNGKIDRKALPAPETTLPFSTDGNYLASRDTLELQLTHLWEKILQTRPIGIRDDFFALGGHSLQAARLFLEIENLCGKSLPLATLFQAPTIEQLAAILREDWKPRWSSLVPLQPGGSKPPFFCVHGGGGHVLFYRDLAKRLGPDQPFYGLQPRTLGGDYPPHRTVEEMAAHYIAELRELQPEGPYYLGGASYGGMIAFEMAQQLRAQGQEVALLALFDTYGPGYIKPTSPWMLAPLLAYDLAVKLEHHLGSLMMLKRGQRLPYWQAKYQKAREETWEWIEGRTKRLFRGIYTRTGRALPPALRETQNLMKEALSAYHPKVYAGPITLFRARRQPFSTYPDPTMGWGKLACGTLEIYDVPGHHAAAISEPRVQFLVEHLQQCLKNAHAMTTEKS